MKNDRNRAKRRCLIGIDPGRWNGKGAVFHDQNLPTMLLQARKPLVIVGPRNSRSFLSVLERLSTLSRQVWSGTVTLRTSASDSPSYQLSKRSAASKRNAPPNRPSPVVAASSALSTLVFYPAFVYAGTCAPGLNTVLLPSDRRYRRKRRCRRHRP